MSEDIGPESIAVSGINLITGLTETEQFRLIIAYLTRQKTN